MTQCSMSSGVFYIWAGMQVVKAGDGKSPLTELGCTSGSNSFGGSNPPPPTKYVSIDKRLSHRPFKAKSRVRIPLEIPQIWW